MSLLHAAKHNNICSIRWDDAIERYGDDTIALSVADMDFQAPQAIIDAVTKRAAAGNFCYTYLDNDYYQAVTNWLSQRHNWRVSSEEIVPVGRMVESLPAILREVVGEQSKVAVPFPAYSPTISAIHAANCKVSPWPLLFVDGHYEYDFATLETLLSNADALVITSPHNPTGRVWDTEELHLIADIARKTHTLVISDEFHMDFLRPGHTFTPYLTCTHEGDQAISFTSPGKTFNIAGLETANIIVPDGQLREKVRKAIDDAGCHNPRFFAQAATIGGYVHSADWLDELLDLINEHALLIHQTLSGIPDVSSVPTEGTYLAWLDMRATGLTDEELEQRLTQHGLALTPGTEFGIGGEGFMRLNMAVPTPLLKQALERLQHAFAE